MLGKTRARLTKLGVLAVAAAALATGVASVTPAIRNANADPTPAATTTGDGVKVSLYDYWDSYGKGGKVGPAYEQRRKNVNLATGGGELTPSKENGNGSNTEAAAGFQFNGQYPWHAWNMWTGAGGDVTQGIVTNNLNGKDYPTMAPDKGGYSLEYLFSSDSEYAVPFENVTGLFGDVQNNHYSYDSAENFAHLNDDKTITLSDGPAVDTTHGNRTMFLPFNTFDEVDTTDGDTQSAANYAFGMKVEATFRQPEGGQVATADGSGKEDMVFNFSGDDDVWLYIDDALVLDIGGIHDARSGSVNFATGAVHVDDGKGDTTHDTTLYDLMKNALGEQWVKENMQKNADGNWVFKDYSNHKMKFFYLERGHSASNCKLEFNLQTVPEGVVDVYKKITNSNTSEFVDAEFEVRVDVAPSEDGTQPENGAYKPYIGKYEIWEGEKKVGDGETTTGNPTFKIKHGQHVRLLNVKKTSWYKVTELAGDNYNKNDYTFDVGNATVESPEGDVIGQSKPIYVAQNPTVTIGNKFEKSGVYSFVVKKQMAGEQTAPANAKFTMRVTNGEGVPYTGTYFLSEDGGESFGDTAYPANNGDIVLEAGQAAKIMDVFAGTTFKVVEEQPDGTLYETPSYSDNEDVSGDTSEQQVTVGTNLKEGVVTVTNTLKTTELKEALKVKKEISGRDWKEGDSFTFVISRANTSSNAPLPNPNTVTVNKSNQTATFNPITYPATEGTYEYVVTEVNNGAVDDLTYSTQQYKVTVKVENGEATVSNVDPALDEDSCMVFTNTLKTNNLTISKTVKGDAANKDEHFKFTLTNAKGVEAGKAYPITYEPKINSNDQAEAKLHPISVMFDAGGNASFQYADGVETNDKEHLFLKHGEKAIINLPAGAEVTVTEVNVTKGTTVESTVDGKANDSDDKTVVNAKIVAKDNTPTEVSFTNTTNLVPNLGVSTSGSLPAAGIAAAAVAGGAALVAAQRRRNASPIGDHARKR